MFVLIFGNGVVGDATGFALKERRHVVAFDDPPKGITYDGPMETVDCALICVPTPMSTEGECDTSAVEEVGAWLERRGYAGLVGIRSTVIMGTCDRMQAEHPGMTWFSWPDFLRVKEARQCELNPTRIVVGWQRGEVACSVVEQICELTLENTTWRGVRCEAVEAEFIKYATNAVHATNVGLANELAALASRYRIDWNALIPPLAQGSEYIPKNIKVTEEGGYGGACLPKDVVALLRESELQDVDLPILASVHAANVARRPEEYE